MLVSDGDGAVETGQDQEPRKAPLEGILVADFSRVLSGPFATMLLGDLGATVVKIERPGQGDESRTWGPPFTGGSSSYYLSANRNKHSVALDLGRPEDRAVAGELAAMADVLVENFRPGTMERHGLGYDAVSAVNPGIVYCGISGFGREGGAHLAGYDFLLQAVGGLMSITGSQGGEPTKVGVALVDVMTALFATIGILAALTEREASGRGQRVDVNLLSSLLSSLVNQASTYLTTGTQPARMGNRHPSVAPYELYQAADGALVIAVGNERQFGALAEGLGRPELAADERFVDNGARVRHRDALRTEIEVALRGGSVTEWVSRLRERGIPCGEVNDLAQAFRFAADLGLDPSFEMAGADGEPVPQVRNPISLSATPVDYRLAPPGLGEHTEALQSILRSFISRAST
jgi:formyl-CoA transferase